MCLSVMEATQRNRVNQIKDTIRSVRASDSPATKTEVFDALQRNDRVGDIDRLRDTYESLRERGEIYSYPNGGVVVVKITDEVL